MQTVLTLEANWARGWGSFHHHPSIPDTRHVATVPEPYQAAAHETDWYLEWVPAGPMEHPIAADPDSWVRL